MSALLRLYPRPWRERYEAEFIDVLAARPPSLGDRLDIVRGALDARLHPELPGSASDPTDARRRVPVAAGLATLSGAAWLAWVAAALSEFRGWDGPMPTNATMVMVLGAIAGFLLAGAHVAVSMTAGDRLRPIGGLAASAAAVMFGGTAFGAGTLGTFALIASAILAVSLGHGTIPRWLAVVWAAAAVVAVAVMIAFVAGNGRDVVILAFIAIYGLAWLVIGAYLWARGVPVATAVERPSPTSTVD